MITKWVFQNWQRKLVALIGAVMVWLFVNHSIIETKVIPNVPIRVIKLPPEKTIMGLLPNGYLKKRISLTVSGTRDIIQELEPGDLEVVIDASMIDRDDWIVRIGKKNVKSLDPDIDLAHHLTYVSHNEFVIKLTRIITAKVPLIIVDPIGETPKGWEFLDIWPRKLTQTLSGPAEEIQRLKSKGLKLQFDLSKISEEDLEELQKEKSGPYRDEVSYPVPEKWKKVRIRFRNNALEDVNDPEVESLHIDFLKKDLLPINRDLPLRVFYPLEYSTIINPQTYPLTTSSKVEERNHLFVFTFPLYVKEVSRLFLDVIRDRIEISLVAAPRAERAVLEWSPEIITPSDLEDTYVAYMIANYSKERNGYSQLNLTQDMENMYRKRFHLYLERTALWVPPHQKFSLEAVLEDGAIKVK